MSRGEPTLRVASLGDRAAIDALMKESAAAHFPRFYEEPVCSNAVRYIAVVDPLLLEDGTYFVFEAGGEIVACGGWSRRGKLYTGGGDAEDDERLLDPATEPARVRDVRARRLVAARSRPAHPRGMRGVGAGGGLPRARAHVHNAGPSSLPRLRLRATRGRGDPAPGRPRGRRGDDAQADRR